MEGENKLLRDYNEIFGDENDKLTKENDLLKKEIARYKGIKVPLRKRQKSSHTSHTSPEESPDENDAIKARVRFFMTEFYYY